MALTIEILLIVVLGVCLINARTVDNEPSADKTQYVTVSKCCRLDEIYLRNETQCVENPDVHWTMNYITLVPILNNFKAGIPENWKIMEDNKPRCNYPLMFVQKRNSFVAFANGSLFITELGLAVDRSSYCIDSNVVLVCSEESENLTNKVKVNRCCGEGAAYSETKRSCVIDKSKSSIELPTNVTTVTSFPVCANESQNYILAGKYDETVILDNGTLQLLESKSFIPSDGYCLEFLAEDNEVKVIACHEYIVSDRYLRNAEPDIRFKLYPIALAISVIFLAATLIAGTLLPASHHVLHWRCQTNHVVCLLVGDTLLCITQLSTLSKGVSCTIIAVSMHFLFLSAFFWLNTMCFNIWWTFRDLRPQNLEKNQERCRLRLYEVYAWGLPLLIAGTAAILDVLPDTANYNSILRPSFGKDKCWFYHDMEIFTYFYGPVGILLIVNLTLFAATARELTCGLWKRELVKSTTERAALGRVCVKLVVVMGVTWIAEIISWAVGGPHTIWYFTDLINGLQGVFIFIVVGCQPQVLTAFKRYWCWRGNRAVETAGTTNHHSSSSQGMPSMGDTVCNNSITNNTKSVALETSC